MTMFWWLIGIFVPNVSYVIATRDCAQNSKENKVRLSWTEFKTMRELVSDYIETRETIWEGRAVKEPYLKKSNTLIVFENLRDYLAFCKVCKNIPVGQNNTPKEENIIIDNSEKYSNEFYKEQYVLVYKIGEYELILSIYPDDVESYVNSGCSVYYIDKDGKRTKMTNGIFGDTQGAIKQTDKNVTVGAIDASHIAAGTIPKELIQAVKENRVCDPSYKFYWDDITLDDYTKNRACESPVLTKDEAHEFVRANFNSLGYKLRCEKTSGTEKSWVNPYNFEEFNLPDGAKISTIGTLWRYFYDSQYVIAWVYDDIKGLHGTEYCENYIKFLTTLGEIAQNSTAKIEDVTICDIKACKQYKVVNNVWGILKADAKQYVKHKSYYLEWETFGHRYGANFTEQKIFDEAVNKLFSTRECAFTNASYMDDNGQYPIELTVETDTQYAYSQHYGARLYKYEDYNVMSRW